MADWTVHKETGRLFRPIYNLSAASSEHSVDDRLGQSRYEWDRPGGPVTTERHEQAPSVIPRQRSTLGPAFPQPREIPYGYPTQLAHGPDHATHHDGPNWRWGLPENTQRSGQADDSRGDTRGKSPGARGHHQLAQDSAPQASSAANALRRTSLDQGSTRVQTENTRRPAKNSISDRSDATASSRSEVSSLRSMGEDLRGLGLGDHASSRQIPPPGASPQSQRWDPILGVVQRNHDTLVRLSLEPSYVIPGGTGEHETLDPRYKRQSEPQKFFRVGRYQEPIYSSIRHMAVVKEQKGCCWCIPITTYGGQGVAKAGVDRGKHAIIYMSGGRPMTKNGEPKMAKEALEVEPARPDQKLDPMSRLNFGKVYTVEHNVKILPVGRLTEASMAKFTAYIKAEFTSK
ncbi:hypothetical protein N7492_009456 [Penicillium capsulatum]|uniref:DUF6590 domain-containing protein n=1 Tax=Penicillium capsulatum TaxID=69766 RepID=A0A9W9HRS1_9EURO|nr:hypothetical protein N7492_009456 [Penicillium capsulatum]KAJ6106847.1 hypothetical protein N7512_010364 [Penicillium capsulatum]